jgi:ribonuclease HII
MPDLFNYENKLRIKGFSLIAGVDEAGRGPLAGPVVAAAVILPEKVNIDKLNDSKQLSPQTREKLVVKIKKNAVDWSIGLATVKEIEFLNIHHASLLAMQRAVKTLSVVPHCLMVDGRFSITHLLLTQFAIIKGDSLSASIAAASILAKVTRDQLMQIFHHLYPVYGFDQHKGYPTAGHLQKLSFFGPCPIHRTGFRPVKALLART